MKLVLRKKEVIKVHACNQEFVSTTYVNTRLTLVLGSRYCIWVLLIILKMYGFHPLRIPDLYFAIIEGTPLCSK